MDKHSPSNLAAYLTVVAGIVIAIIGAIGGYYNGGAAKEREIEATQTAIELAQGKLATSTPNYFEITRVVEATRIVMVEVTRIVEVNSTKESTPYPTYTAYPTYTPYPTYTSTVENSHQPEDLLTPIPSATNATSSDKILEASQAWQQGEYEVTMTNPKLWPDGYGFSFGFIFTSKKSQKVTIEYSLADVSAVDNLGNQLEVSIDGQGRLGTNKQCQPTRVVIEPQRTYTMYCSLRSSTGSNNLVTNDFNVRNDTANPKLTEIIVSLGGTLGIDNARWRIIIPH